MKERITKIVYNTSLALAIGLATYGVAHLTTKGAKHAFRPVEVEVVDANNDGQPDLSILNQRGDEYILYGNSSEKGYWLDKIYRNDLEKLAIISNKTPRYEEGINVNQSLNDQLYDGIGKRIYEKNGLGKKVCRILFPGYEKRYIRKYIQKER